MGLSGLFLGGHANSLDWLFALFRRPDRQWGHFGAFQLPRSRRPIRRRLSRSQLKQRVSGSFQRPDGDRTGRRADRASLREPDGVASAADAARRARATLLRGAQRLGADLGELARRASGGGASQPARFRSTRSASAAIHFGCSLRQGITWNSFPPAATKRRAALRCRSLRAFRGNRRRTRGRRRRPASPLLRQRRDDVDRVGFQPLRLAEARLERQRALFGAKVRARARAVAPVTWQ